MKEEADPAQLVMKVLAIVRSHYRAGKRKKLGFCKAFAEVHAANERMHNLFIEWSAANC